MQHETIEFIKRIDETELISMLKNIEFRGLYDSEGNKIRPYKNAKFSLVKVWPPTHPTSFPQVMHNLRPHPLFTAQPTIYKTITNIMSEVDGFLKSIGKNIYDLGFEGIEYMWKERGMFHILPPVIEKHSYPLVKGIFDLKKLSETLKGAYVKDAKGNLHEISNGALRDYFIDQEDKINYLEVFNHNAELINYGMRFTGNNEFYIICDGSHRMDYALEILDQPITAILVEPEEGTELYPYYAFPLPFRPATRLTSKEAEQKYPKLERDKIHLLNDFIKKVLHYEWGKGGLSVSKLRGKAKIH